MEVRLSRSTLVGVLVIAFLIGLAIGTAVLAWQRVVLMGKVTEAEQRLEAVQKDTLGNAEEIRTLRAGLESAEDSIAALAARNSRLASELADARGTNQDEGGSAGTGPVTYLSRGVSPATVDPGQSITLTVKLKGKPGKVRMRIVAREGDYDKTFTLSKVSSASGTQTWRATVHAPSDSGEYRYFATAWVGSKRYEMPGVSAWTFLVR